MGRYGSERKKRDPQITYRRKIDKITKWYNRLMKEREKRVINPNTKEEPKRKELKDLDYYISKISKPRGE